MHHVHSRWCIQIVLLKGKLFQHHHHMVIKGSNLLSKVKVLIDCCLKVGKHFSFSVISNSVIHKSGLCFLQITIQITIFPLWNLVCISNFKVRSFFGNAWGFIWSYFLKQFIFSFSVLKLWRNKNMLIIITQ